MTTMRIHEATGRPIYRGLPVAWITTWTAERRARDEDLWPIGFSADGSIYYQTPALTSHPFGVEHAKRAQRDELGLLWFPDPVPGMQDQGEPLFAEMQPARHRACMRDRLCQVCGRAFGPDEPVTFLEATEIDDTRPGATGPLPRSDQPFTTFTPPTCRDCVPVAMRFCPHQRTRPRVIITPGRMVAFNVQGDVYDPRTGAHAKMRTAELTERATVARMVVKQLGMLISDYTQEAVS